jgi:hypothetical protein
MGIRGLTSAGVITATALLLSAGTPQMAGAGPAAAPVDGVWRSDGYATVLSVARGRATLYQTTAGRCVEGTVTTQEGGAGADGTVRFAATEQMLGFTLRAEGGSRRLVQHSDGSVGDRHLKRLSRLPGECGRPTATGPLATFDVFWQTYAENYPFFAAKGVDWDRVRDRYRPRITADMTDDQLFAVLRAMIEPLGDAHTGIRTGRKEFVGHRPGTTFPDEQLEAKVRPVIEDRDLGRPLQDFGNGRVGYADLPGRLGYLRVIAFAGYTGSETWADDSAEFDRALDAVFTPARTSGPAALRGLVIDLRINGGGHDELGLRLASRLTAKPYLAYRKQARNQPTDPRAFTDPQPIRVRPADGPRYLGPLVILGGGSTISAGETFTQAMLGRSPHAVRVGANTQGVFPDTLIRALPNGWMFILPNERFLTREGRSFDGPGIPPDVRTPVFTAEELAAGKDSAFDRAMTLLAHHQ